jgi:hypothetical protein
MLEKRVAGDGPEWAANARAAPRPEELRFDWSPPFANSNGWTGCKDPDRKAVS